MFCFLILLLSSTIFAQISYDDVQLQLPVLMSNESVVNFVFNIKNVQLESEIQNFCILNSIEETFCQKLFEHVTVIRFKYLEEEMIRQELLQNKPIINTQFIPKPHLERTAIATSSEIDNHFKSNEFTQQLEQHLEEVLYQIKLIIYNRFFLDERTLSQLPSQSQKWMNQNHKRIIMIHSCSLPHEHNRILISLLKSIINSNLVYEVQAIFIFNYGLSVTTSLQNYIQSYPSIYLFQVFDDISYFEVPTMILIQQISLWIHHQQLIGQVLYLHTKGISYQYLYPQIEDWREYMLYFLVEHHQICYHLLASNEFDALGSNFKTFGRDFRGNFWWALTTYLHMLMPLSLYQHSKYDAEKWMLNGKILRIYNFHESHVDHHVTRYERFQYHQSFHIQDIYQEYKQRKENNMMNEQEEQSSHRNTLLSYYKDNKIGYCRAICLTWWDEQ
jgi:hypothetical protein